MYHINNEGKVYPCRAIVRNCPYGKEWHAETQDELYYKMMRVNPQAEISENVVREVAITGRLRSLYPISHILEDVSYPIEIIITNLEYAIDKVENKSPEETKRRWDRFEKQAAEKVYEALSYNLNVSEAFPIEIRAKGRELFEERLNGKYIDFASATGNKVGFRIHDELKKMEAEIENYKHYKRFALTDENKEGTLGWMKADFYQFSHDLNTSKMLTRPIFYGDLNEAKKKIKSLSDYELLGAYDDYLISDEEILKNVNLANGFKFEPRPDLSREANLSLKRWYDRNRKIVDNWIDNTPKRVLLSMEMSKELDRRKIKRQ